MGLTHVHPETAVNLFAGEPFDFDTEYSNALKGDPGPGLDVRFVSVQTLIAMKEATGRARDTDDVEHLKRILEERAGEEPGE